MGSNLTIVEREEFLLERCANHDVLHLGCTDAPLTAEKAKTGDLLHQKLATVAKSLVGVDLDAAVLEYLRREHGMENLYHHNIEHLDRLPIKNKFDRVVAAEVIEHLDNPGLFFDSCRNVLTPDGVLIVTTPNASSVKRFLAALFIRREHVHADHTAYFSPSTLACIARRHHFAPSPFKMFMWKNPTARNRVANFVGRSIMSSLQAPLVADGVIVELQMDPSSEPGPPRHDGHLHT